MAKSKFILDTNILYRYLNPFNKASQKFISFLEACKENSIEVLITDIIEHEWLNLLLNKELEEVMTVTNRFLKIKEKIKTLSSNTDRDLHLPNFDFFETLFTDQAKKTIFKHMLETYLEKFKKKYNIRTISAEKKDFDLSLRDRLKQENVFFKSRYFNEESNQESDDKAYDKKIYKPFFDSVIYNTVFRFSDQNSKETIIFITTNIKDFDRCKKSRNLMIQNFDGNDLSNTMNELISSMNSFRSFMDKLDLEEFIVCNVGDEIKKSILNDLRENYNDSVVEIILHADDEDQLRDGMKIKDFDDVTELVFNNGYSCFIAKECFIDFDYKVLLHGFRDIEFLDQPDSEDRKEIFEGSGELKVIFSSDQDSFKIEKFEITWFDFGEHEFY